MVTSQEFKAAAEAPIVLSEQELRYADMHGAMMVDACPTFRSKFGGQEEQFRIGKRTELAFWKWLSANHIEPMHTPFRYSYAELSKLDDFVVYGRKVEIKSGCLKQSGSNSRYDQININSFGLQVPVEQAGVAQDVDYFVYILADTSAASSAIVGWCSSTMVLMRPVTKTYHDCYRVPIAELKPMSSLAEAIQTASKATLCNRTEAMFHV